MSWSTVVDSSFYTFAIKIFVLPSTPWATCFSDIIGFGLLHRSLIKHMRHSLPYLRVPLWSFVLRSSTTNLMAGGSCLWKDLLGKPSALLFWRCMDRRFTLSSPFETMVVHRSELLCLRCQEHTARRWWTWKSIFRPVRWRFTSQQCLQFLHTTLDEIGAELVWDQWKIGCSMRLG